MWEYVYLFERVLIVDKFGRSNNVLINWTTRIAKNCDNSLLDEIKEKDTHTKK